MRFPFSEPIMGEIAGNFYGAVVSGGTLTQHIELLTDGIQMGENEFLALGL